MKQEQNNAAPENIDPNKYWGWKPDELRNEYMRVIGEPIPLMEVMGNGILVEQFHDNDWEVYEYCLLHKKTWQQVLQFTPDYSGKVVY